VRITDLGGTTLGMVSGNTIYLDDNAVGWSWFVDATPWDDSEFTTPGDQREQGRMDLLSVVMHEMGHRLGFEHTEDSVMAAALAPGTYPRRVRRPRDLVLLDQFFAAGQALSEQQPLSAGFPARVSWPLLRQAGRKA